MLLTDEREELHQYEKPEPFFGPAPRALLEGLRNRPELELHILSCSKRPMAAPAKLADNIWFHLLEVGQSGWLRSLYWGCVTAIRRKLGEIRPDVVHGQGTERYCALAAAFSGFPSVITIHGNMRAIAKVNHASLFSYGWFSAKLEALTLPRVGGVICVSSHTQALVVRHTPQTWVIPNAVSSQFFKPRSVGPEAKDILCVGTICRLKNQNALIRALDSIASRYKFRLVFLGDGKRDDPYMQEFLKLVNERPWCTHQGVVANDQLETFFNRAIALALPSLEDNCPMVILEAAASGLPVLAAKVGGIPDLIHSGETGVLFDPINLSSIASAAECYLADPVLAERIANNARALAMKRYRPELVGSEHLEVYRQIATSA